MSYQISILRRAQKALGDLLQQKNYQRVRDAIRDLADNPRPSSSLKLTGRPAWSIRVGVYRIIYEIDDKAQEITVLDIGHRRDIYR